MAKKQQQATKRAAPAKARKPAKPRTALEQIERDIQALKAERDDLRTELAAAKQRISELEAVNEAAVNRIDWVLDSLHSLLEK
jgi:hypothetical protein